MSADEELGYVYLPLDAAPTNDWYGGHRLGDNLFADSLVCLDAATGKRVWHFQTVHHDLWDYDTAGRADPGRHQRRRPADQGGRAAHEAGVRLRLRPRDRQAGVADRRAAGAASTVPGEKASPTQPFPTRPAPFDRQGITTTT